MGELFGDVNKAIHQKLDEVLDRPKKKHDGRYFILVNGEVIPATALEWGLWFENNDNRRVAETDVGDVAVSTVCLGLNHAVRSVRPIIFETMIFGGEYDESQWRYSTLEEAVAGHNIVVECLRGGTDPSPVMNSTLR